MTNDLSQKQAPESAVKSMNEMEIETPERGGEKAAPLGKPMAVVTAALMLGVFIDSILYKKQMGLQWALIINAVLLALPLLALFGMLLGAADQIFSEQLKGLFGWLTTASLEDLLIQVALISILAYGLFGALRFALTQTKPVTLEPDRPMFKPFLGLTEASVVLILINLMFAAFLVVQVRYFFAGEAAIHPNGFTYAEYARRGFFELVAVGCLTWAVHYVLSAVTRRETGGQRAVFSILTSLLVLQVGVILVSAFQRLSLYEQAYGFTQDRLVAHVFMIFLGLILLASLVMEWTRQFRRTALVLLLAFMGFGFTLAGINVDRTIARWNIAAAQSNGKLDARYLVHNVTADAEPALFDGFASGVSAPKLEETLGKVLACRAEKPARWLPENGAWLGYHQPEANAEALFAVNAQALSHYPILVYEESDKGYNEGVTDYGVEIDGEWITCRTEYEGSD